MHYLQILYEPDLYDDVIVFLKRKFANDLAAVSVDQIIPNTLIKFTWQSLLDPNDLASELTKKHPTLVIDCPSITGIDTTSRYFNKTQLY